MFSVLSGSYEKNLEEIRPKTCEAVKQFDPRISWENLSRVAERPRGPGFESRLAGIYVKQNKVSGYQ